MARSYLVLEDGAVFEGEPFGYRDSAFGEVVFSTGMCGYQESLTDPSFRGQIIVMTFPLIGNYGISNEMYQSRTVHARGLVVRECCMEPSAMYGGKTLDEFLVKNKVPGISGVDTREIAIRIRNAGTLKCAITEDKDGIEDLIAYLRKTPAPSEGNLVKEVACRSVEKHDFGKKTCIGILDCGDKSNLMRTLSSRFNVISFPYDTPADVIHDTKVRGILISNGPGNPAHPEIMKTAVKSVQNLSALMPVFGICFGSHVVGLAMGGKTYKMKFGHHGGNQPVRYQDRVYITSQNHGFAVDEHSLDGKDLIADQINVNDGTVEGLRHRDLPVFTSQYHPESCPGPRDTSFLLEEFERIAKEGRL